MKYHAIPGLLLPLGQSFPKFIVSAWGDCKDKENTGAMLMQLYMTDWTTSAKIDLPITPLSPLMSCCFLRDLSVLDRLVLRYFILTSEGVKGRVISKVTGY